MALHSTATTARNTVAVSLSALLAACSFGGPKYVEVLDRPATGNDRFTATETEDYTAVVPRGFIESEELEPDAPESYTVVKGDTLWDISDMFLKKPWLWPEIWDYNPQIANPHLIYPGDELTLEYINGKPTLILSRNGKSVQRSTPGLGAANPVLDATGNPIPNTDGRERLSPRIRAESLDDAVPMISGDEIAQFLVHPQVVDLSDVNGAPYVVGNFDGRLASAVGHQIYARGTMNRDQTSYGIFRKNKALLDPVTGELLGHEVIHVADAKLLNIGDPSTLAITSNKMETIAGDILLPSSDDGALHSYTPRLPEINGEGRIVSLVNAITQTGRDQVVVLNLGKRSGVQPGDVMAIETRGDAIIDPHGRSRRDVISAPNIRTGVVMVFRTFDKVSYGLVMESTRPVVINDIVTGI